MGIDAVTEEDSEGMALEAFANAIRTALPPDGVRVPLMDIMKLFGKVDGLRSAFSGCVGTDRDPNHYTVANLMRRCENKIFVADNPGHKFTINKRKDTIANVWRWGVEYVE